MLLALPCALVPGLPRCQRQSVYLLEGLVGPASIAAHTISNSKLKLLVHAAAAARPVLGTAANCTDQTSMPEQNE